MPIVDSTQRAINSSTPFFGESSTELQRIAELQGELLWALRETVFRDNIREARIQWRDRQLVVMMLHAKCTAWYHKISEVLEERPRLKKPIIMQDACRARERPICGYTS